MIFSQKLVDHYNELKDEAPDCVLCMQVGAFMQVMNEDAHAVSQVTGLKLRMAGEVNAPVVLGGFPKSGLDAYADKRHPVGKLVRAGHSVAIALQDEQKERHVEETISSERIARSATISNWADLASEGISDPTRAAKSIKEKRIW